LGGGGGDKKKGAFNGLPGEVGGPCVVGHKGIRKKLEGPVCRREASWVKGKAAYLSRRRQSDGLNGCWGESGGPHKEGKVH